MKRFIVAFVAGALMLSGSVALADETGKGTDAESLIKRIEALEKKIESQEVTDDLGHKYHPIHSIYGLKIGGGITMVAQGATHTKNAATNGAFTLSADIALESKVGSDGRAIGVLDYQRGTGLSGLPAFFTSPNGNASGTNADIEGFNDTSLHVTQFYYEHDFSEDLVVSVGQLDMTGYFDTNEFANNERSQFLANIFVNNPTIEWGGSADFYSPGARMTWFPAKTFDISLGVFEGNGDYAEPFDRPFYIGEANLKISPAGKDGNYRIYYWNRQGRELADVANTATPTNNDMRVVENKGVGLSADQWITDDIGVWLRLGTQREAVAQFDRHLSLGVNLSGRGNDVAGIGYAQTHMGKVYKDYLRSANASLDLASERYLEAYYNYAVGDATDITGLHITPDIQYVVNPGGDTNATKVFVYGVRMQAFF